MPKSSKYYLQALHLGWDKNSLPDRQRLKLLDKFISGKKILDVGCGWGKYVDFLAKKGFDATGLDFVEEFIIWARKFKKGTFVKGNADSLPFKNSLFDTVLLFDILEHGDDKKILFEAKRVSKDTILAVVPRKVDFKLEQSGVIFRHYLDKSHIREYEEEDIKNLAESVNIKLMQIIKIHPLYNETIFLNLFNGPIFVKKLIRKIAFFILPKTFYPTEYFAVFKK